MLTFKINDFAEFNKLIDLTLDGVYNDRIATISVDDKVNIFTVSTKCTNCDEIFEKDAFDRHICQYDANKDFIFDDIWMHRLFRDSPLMKLQRENQRQIKEFLKDFNETASKSTAYSCHLCKREYVHPNRLARHMENHHHHQKAPVTVMAKKQNIKIEMLQCMLCGQAFNQSATCYKHLKSIHPEFGGNFDEMDPIEETLMFEKIQIDRLIKCEFCNGLFTESSSLQQHELSHDINIGYQCNNCEIASRNLKFILSHRNNDCPYRIYDDDLEKVDVTTNYVCTACDETVTSITKLYEHRYMAKHFQALYNRQTNRYEYFCEKCSRIFGELDELLEHNKEMHSKKIPSNAPATMSDELTRPFLCEICGKGYTQSSHLYQHLRFHKGIKPFECTFESCTRRFTIRPDLNDHIRKCHTGERPYKCTECSKTFLTGSVYYQHRLIHRNERRYGCRYDGCNKRFHRSDALKNHERIHSGEKPYTCGACTKKFRQKGDRDKHFRSRHQNSIKSFGATKS